MKTLKNLALVLLVSLAVTACSKKDDGGDDPQGGSGSFTAKVDGDSFTGITGTVVAQVNNSTLAVSGGTSDAENLQVIISGFDGEGTYDLGLTNIGTYSYIPDPSNPDPSTVVVYTTVGNGQGSNGTLSVSSFDGNTVKGTFTFTAYNLDDANDSVSVINGEFNIEVTN